MIQNRRATTNYLIGFIFTAALLFSINATAQDGKALFSQNCASCHAVKKDLVGPALAGTQDRWPDKKNLYAWIKNSQAFLKTGDKYANDLFAKYNKIPMNAFTLEDAEIDAILAYIDSESKDAPAPAANVNAPQAAQESGDNTLLFGILTLVLAVVALILLQVNSNLKKISDESQGLKAHDPVPFYKNKSYIALVTVVLFCIGGYMTVKGAIGLGRNQNYQPEQPIFYSHKVHAGINQINCLYCHGGAQEGKHSNIPSLNVCMNCHMAINEYTGKEKLYKEDGTEVNGTEEIKKLYEYAGYDPSVSKVWDPSKAKPIEWVKIHNLPDHVYFNHSQHVTAGKVECQTCHGEIQKMDEVKQFADLSMGWCVNCHRTTKVQFKENGFYSIYEKYHEDIKSGKMEKAVTVEKIGGTECQKCHY
jgi:mono/diheme cytochrome c family protein